MGYNPAVQDGTVYLAGREDLDGSLRFTTDADTGFTEIQGRVDGVWQPADFETGPRSLWLGRNVGVASIGKHMAMETADGMLHFMAHNKFDGETNITDTHIINATSFEADVEVQPDQSGTWSGTVLEYSIPVTAHTLLSRLSMKTGTIAASSPVRFQIWMGTDDTGQLIFDQTYSTATFAANSDAVLILDGHTEYEDGTDIFTRISSDNTFSLKTNAVQTIPYYKVDYSYLVEDNLLQTQEWIDGGAYTEGEYFINDRMIYVCNVTGTQTGTFASNADKWVEFGADVLHGEHWKRVGTTLSPTVVGDDMLVSGVTVKDTGDTPTINFRDSANFSHGRVRGYSDAIEITSPNGATTYFKVDTGSGQVFCNDDLIVNYDVYGEYLYLTGDIEAVNLTLSDSLEAVNATLTGDLILMGTGKIESEYGLHINPNSPGDVRLFDGADIADITDGKRLYVYRRAVEGDSYIALYVHRDQQAHINSNVDIILSQGTSNALIITVADHVVNAPYGLQSGGLDVLVSETDPVFTAWDRSTGIVITESQISNLNHFVTGDETDPVFTAWDKSTGITIQVSQITDHSYSAADLTGFDEGEIAYGNSLGSGLRGSSVLKFDGTTMTFSNATTGRKINLHGSNFALGVESGELRIATGSSDIVSFYAGGYDGSETARIEAGGWLKVVGGVRAPEIWSSGDLKLQPDVQGDIILFGDTDVDNAIRGKELRIWRRAAEGNAYFRMYIDANKKGMIHSSSDLTFQGQVTFTLNSVTQDIVLKVGDNAGAKKVYFKDSDGVNVVTIDSNGFTKIFNDMLVQGPNGFGSAGETATLQLGDAQNYLVATYGENVRLHGYSGVEISDDVGGVATFKDGLINDGVTKYANQETQSSHYDLWDCTTAKYKQTKALTAWGTGPHDSAWSPDGKKAFVVDNTSQEITEFDLTTPWDVSTMGWIYTMSTTSEESNPQGLCFNHDGTKMFITGAGSDKVNMYTLSTAWALSTATPTNLKDLSGNSNVPMGIRFSPDGLKMFISDGSLDELQLWILTTAWDVTTASYTTKFDASMDTIEGFSFSPDGRRLYVVDGGAEDDIHEYELLTPWDITTGIHTRSLDLTGLAAMPNGVTFSPNGHKMYVTDNDPGVDGLLEFDMGFSIDGNVQLNLDAYANNAAAITGGLSVGTLYRDGNDPDAVCIVH